MLKNGNCKIISIRAAAAIGIFYLPGVGCFCLDIYNNV